jgi:tRNA(Arg) A34 adenosine deaminase TadA/DNA-directed RNA polymerase specialized sigma24 family protein
MDENEFDDFFAAKPITFSERWKMELKNRLERLKEKNTRQYLGSLHEHMIREMRDTGKRMLRGKFSDYKAEDIEDILQDAFIKWQSSFDATKASTAEFPEHHWFLLCTSTAQIDWYHKQNPTINTNVVLLDETGFPLLDESGKAMHKKTKAFFVSFPDNIHDSSDDLEDSEPMQKANTDGDKIKELVADVKVDNEKENGVHTNLIELAGKRFSEVASNEIMKYYLLSKRISTNGKENTLPPIYTIYKPLKKSISYQVRHEFDNMSDVSIKELNRFQFLRNAENRKWMEMAIGEMRKSLEKLNSFIKSQKIKNPRFDETKFRQNTPILSSIAISRDGSHVSSCFKGQVSSFIGDRDLTFDKHCEFSLFTEIISEDKLPLYKDGVLYVTLEPCNKRGFWLDGGLKKPKIPCAVRCVEAGFKKVYIGSLDDNKEVYKKGKEILESGKFIFPLEKGCHIGTPKQIEAAELLKDYFESKDYPYELYSNKIVFQIGNPIEVHDFEADLIEEVRKLNSAFLQRHSPSFFRM